MVRQVLGEAGRMVEVIDRHACCFDTICLQEAGPGDPRPGAAGALGLDHCGCGELPALGRTPILICRQGRAAAGRRTQAPAAILVKPVRPDALARGTCCTATCAPGLDLDQDLVLSSSPRRRGSGPGAEPLQQSVLSGRRARGGADIADTWIPACARMAGSCMSRTGWDSNSRDDREDGFQARTAGSSPAFGGHRASRLRPRPHSAV